MTTKVRVEFCTLVQIGSPGGVSTDMPAAFYGAQEITATGLVAEQSAAAPTFGVQSGNPLKVGVARVRAISGNAIVLVGDNPEPVTDLAGFRIAAGDAPLDLPIITGQLVGICEATD